MPFQHLKSTTFHGSLACVMLEASAMVGIMFWGRLMFARLLEVT